MGGEGANWVGEAPFSTRAHVFQNLGDGTYNHSGVQAIRAALAAGVNITYKILFNDAVAMTGGQPNEGGLSAPQIVREIAAMGVKPIVVVYDEKEQIDLSAFPPEIEKVERAGLMAVQKRMAQEKGTSAIVYVQTCAAEKRRRRKRGTFPDPDKRVFINTDVCEGCGDCGVQSNCVSLVPVETEFGTKRAVDQSSCNKDFSCLNGFCPSFVTVAGAKLRKAPARALDLPDLPEPALPTIQGTHNIVITGVGGTGVVTVGAVLAMAAHLDGKGAGMMEMAGLAQKGGAVHIHLRLANDPADISAIRVAVGEADCVIGGDLVVSAGSKTLGLMTTGRTGAVVNAHEIVTGEFTRNRDFHLPGEQLRLALQARLRDRVAFFDATDLTRHLLGDSIYSNMAVLGAAWQQGLVPLSHAAIARAITLNGTAAEANQRAFELGRWAVAFPDEAQAALAPEAPPAPADPIETRAAHLVAYQNAALADRFRALVARAPEALREAVAKGYHKLLAYKDEYEVARLHLDTAAKAQAEFEGDLRLTFHLAPPFLSGPEHNGRPAKRAFGPWVLRAFAVLARMKGLRGTAFDPFGRTKERRTERALIAQFEADMAEILPRVTPETEAIARELAELPLQIRGFGPVKEASVAAAAARRAALLAAFRAGGAPMPLAAE
jgi:indolepyruvate ferredoxin oxidoreductase